MADRLIPVFEFGLVEDALRGKPSPGSLYTRTEAGSIVCRLCARVDRAHADDCVVMTLHAQVQELASALGLFVATMRETMDALDAVVRGER